MGDFKIREGIAAHGNYSLLLDNELNRSPVYTLEGIKSGDVVSSSVKSNISKDDEIDNIVIICEYTDINGNTVTSTSDPSPGRIDDAWYMSDLFSKMESQPADSSVRCYVKYTGNKSVRLDDFTLKIYSKNPW